MDNSPIIKLTCDRNLINTLADTGTQLTVVKTNIIPEKHRYPHGSVILTSTFGLSLKAFLINLPLSKYSQDVLLALSQIFLCSDFIRALPYLWSNRSSAEGLPRYNEWLRADLLEIDFDETHIAEVLKFFLYSV
ncbi:hypothetical protein CDAR_181911 [Caerostris darwini]|nr:hypothetical protein CDAR_181911 [Caerostris darwini]